MHKLTPEQAHCLSLALFYMRQSGHHDVRDEITEGMLARNRSDEFLRRAGLPDWKELDRLCADLAPRKPQAFPTWMVQE